MAKASVIGHVGDRITKVQDDVHIGQRAQGGANQQGLAAMPAPQHGTSD